MFFCLTRVDSLSVYLFTYAWNISLQKYTVNIILNIYWFRGSTSTKWFLVYLILGRIVILQCWFLRRGENRSAQRKKTIGAKERTNNKLYPHMASMLGLETQATLVGGECSHHCAIPCSLLFLILKVFEKC